ncbi:MAG: fused MFS/spermidine synthase [Myxococcota bacterium]|nr:fused MFS/spermidine synthase [Myxococcota bacterium]
MSGRKSAGRANSGAMAVLDATERRERSLPFLLGLFFFSGATGLIYQTLWARRLHLLFGTSQFAVATVLAAFMAGLGIGGFWMARRADRIEAPLRVYGLLEVGIGIYAVLFPWILDLTLPLTLNFYTTVSPSPLVFGIWQMGIVGVLLLLPTICMGATLPLLARFVSTRFHSVGSRIGILYGANTFGAVFGVWLGGFFLLPWLGQSTTNHIAALANLLLGVAALLLSRNVGERSAPVMASSDDPDPPVSAMGALMWVAALSGFAALVYELAWFRLMCLILGGSTYAFSTMLLAFLVGIALGGWLGGKPADLSLQRWGAPGPLRVLVGVQVAIGVSSCALMWVYPELPYLFVQLYDPDSADLGLSWMRQVWLAVLVMTGPALLMGASFPLLVRAVASRDGLGRAVGRIYGANTLGSLFGAVLAGFVFLPRLHVLGAVGVGVVVNLLAALIAGVESQRVGRGVRPAFLAGGVLTALIAGGLVVYHPPKWDPLWMSAGTYKYVSDLSDRSRAGVESFAVEDYELLYYDEGFSTVVTVARSVETGNIWLANNGKVEASTTVDMLTQVLVSHLPFLFAPQAQRVSVIGLASGITAGALTLHPAVQEIEIVELEPSIIEASHAFDTMNHRPLEDDRVELVIADGRNHLLFTPTETWDVIVSQPSNPWLSGVSNLFTREFFEMGRDRLTEDGVWSQWVQLYGMGQEDLRSLLATFRSVFPHVALFSTIEDADIVLIGSKKPLRFGIEDARRILEGAVGEQLVELGVQGPYDLLLHYLMDEAALDLLVGGEGLNTDDNMRIEFSAPHYLHSSTASENLLFLLRESVIHELDTIEDNLALAQAYGRREDWTRGMVVLKRVLDAEPGHAEAAVLFREYRALFQAAQATPED